MGTSKRQQKPQQIAEVIAGSGGWIRTSDIRVNSAALCHSTTPECAIALRRKRPACAGLCLLVTMDDASYANNASEGWVLLKLFAKRDNVIQDKHRESRASGQIFLGICFVKKRNRQRMTVLPR